MNTTGLEELRALPCIIFRWIWLARNSTSFEGKYIPTFQVISQVGALLSSIRVVENPTVPHQVDKAAIEKFAPLVLLTGALLLVVLEAFYI